MPSTWCPGQVSMAAGCPFRRLWLPPATGELPRAVPPAHAPREPIPACRGAWDHPDLALFLAWLLSSRLTWCRLFFPVTFLFSPHPPPPIPRACFFSGPWCPLGLWAEDVSSLPGLALWQWREGSVSPSPTDASVLVAALTHFSHVAADTIVNGGATSHLAPTDPADRKWAPGLTPTWGPCGPREGGGLHTGPGVGPGAGASSGAPGCRPLTDLSPPRADRHVPGVRGPGSGARGAAAAAADPAAGPARPGADPAAGHPSAGPGEVCGRGAGWGSAGVRTRG